MPCLDSMEEGLRNRLGHEPDSSAMSPTKLPAHSQLPEGADPPNAPKWVRALVWLLDDAIRIPGTNFRLGLDAIVGLLLPTAGDILTAFAGTSLLLLGIKLRLPSSTLCRMAANIALDLLVGTLPIVGDLADLSFRSNRKNLELLRAARQMPVKRWRPGEYLLVASALLALVGLTAGSAYIAWLLYSSALSLAGRVHAPTSH